MATISSSSRSWRLDCLFGAPHWTYSYSARRRIFGAWQHFDHGDHCRWPRHTCLRNFQRCCGRGYGHRPQHPRVYQEHRTNLDALRRSPLDWSILCLGPMIASENGKPTGNLRLSVDEWPMKPPAYTYVLPRLAMAFALKQRMPEMTITYEDAAEVIGNNLSKSGLFSRHRDRATH